LQFLGQSIMATVFGGAVAANGGQLVASAGQLAALAGEGIDVGAVLGAWGTACWVAVLPVALVAFICSFFLRPPTVKDGSEKKE
jgi:hypothetical protein